MKRASGVVLGLAMLLLAAAMAPLSAQGEAAIAEVDESVDLQRTIHPALLAAERAATEPTLRVAQVADAPVPMVEDRVVVDITVDGDPAETLAVLETIGLENASSFGGLISGEMPVSQVSNLGRVNGVQMVLPAYALTNIGSVTAQSDDSMRARDARTAFGVNGAGITIGTLSDSFDCAGTQQAADVASGDLPNGIVVLDDSQCPGIDEGRAMMQIIRDSAPGAAQQFHTAFGGQADFANGILELAAAGSDVINDDVFYFAEPYFQDGVITQAVDQVAAQGIPYFSSAGNSDRDSYEGNFVDSGQTYTNPFGAHPAHDFQSGGGVDITQRISIPQGRTLSLGLQWAQPFASVTGGVGATTDLDLWLLDSAGNVAASSAFNNTGGDPVEIIQYTNTTGSTQFDLVITRYSGPNPGLMKYIGFRNLDILEHDTNSGTSVGHSVAAEGFGVGAAFYADTPEFGQTPPLLEPFSSAGGTTILFEVDGTPTNELRNKPDIVAPDGVDTTFFGSDADGNGFPNFFGTSAAAPAAAAGAALILDAVPGATLQQVRTALESTAIDMGPSGFDFDSGVGLIQIDAAIAYLMGGTCNGLIVTVDIGAGDTPTGGNDVILGTSGADTINGLGGNDTICGEGGNDVLLGGPGNDDIFGGTGADTLTGSAGNDTLYGDGGIDVINGGAGADVIYGGAGADDLRGQGGDDTLNGDGGIDQFFGGSGGDTINTGAGGNRGTGVIVQGQSGPDTIIGSSENDELDGGLGQDVIRGGAGNDILNGGRSGDTLLGEDGSDLLFGGPDRDTLNGGDGNDTCNGGGGTSDTATATCESVTLVP